jgi:hypothetical protein
VSTSIPPPKPSGGGNAKYAAVGILLLLVASVAIYFATRTPPPAAPPPHPVATPAPDVVQQPVGPTIGMNIDLNAEMDAGPDVVQPEAGAPRIRYVTHYVGGTCNGQIDNEGVNAAARNNIGGMRECYNRALRSNASLRGNVHARWIINPGGAVGDVTTTISDPQFRACFETALRRVHFPPPRGGCATADFNFPLTAN